MGFPALGQAASALAGLHLILLCCIRTCWTASRFAVLHPHFLDCISFCCTASALPGLHLILLCCIRTCWTASRFAVLHPHFLDCISFCCAASALPGLHLVLLYCIRTSWTASHFAVLHPRFLDCISFCCTASALPGLHLILLCCIRASWTASQTNGRAPVKSSGQAAIPDLVEIARKGIIPIRHKKLKPRMGGDYVSSKCPNVLQCPIY